MLETIIRKHIKAYYGFDSAADKLTMPLSRIIPMMEEYAGHEKELAIAAKSLVAKLKAHGYYSLEAIDKALEAYPEISVVQNWPVL